MKMILIQISNEDYDEITQKYFSFNNTLEGRVLKAIKDGNLVSLDKEIIPKINEATGITFDTSNIFIGG